MADFEGRNVNTSFKGLTTTVALFAVVGTICLVGFETMRQLRRLPKVAFVPFWKRDERERQGGKGGVDRSDNDDGGSNARNALTCEDWEMGHLYLARMFHAKSPTPAMAPYPLAWAFQALKFDDWFYATHTGMDTVVYVRFLRGCVLWLLLQTCTTAPILLAIHFKFSEGAPLSDMNSASLSLLVAQCDPNVNYGPKGPNYITCPKIPNEDGRRLLWIHLCLLWYITATWFFTLWWIAKGSIRIRRRWIKELGRKRKEAKEQKKKITEIASTEVAPTLEMDANKILQSAQGLESIAKEDTDDSDGWRQRTLLVTNLPPTMRDEASVRRYFEEFLRPDTRTPMSSVDDLNNQETNDSNQQEDVEGKLPLKIQKTSLGAKTSNSTEKTRMYRAEEIKTNPYAKPSFHSAQQISQSDQRLRSPVQTVVLVRKMNELSAMLSRRQEVLGLLEAAHIKLARTILTKIGQQSERERKDATERNGHFSNLSSGASRLVKRTKRRRDVNEHEATEGDMEKDAPLQSQEDALRLKELTQRLGHFVLGNRRDESRESHLPGVKNEAKEKGAISETVWEALAEVPRELLDSYQPVTRLSSLFRGQKVPTIDYLLTKLNLLTALVTEMRARSPNSYEPTSTAFVTFRDPRQARMVWRELKSQIVVKVRLAPEVKDLDWERLMRTSFTGDIVRGFGVNTFFWFATILWVVPVNLLCTSLFSVTKLEEIFPSIQKFFQNNPTFQGFVSNTLPSLIVALLTMAVPEVIFQISKRAQGFVTFSALYDECLCRYWKFVICNVVIFFCIGSTTVQSVIFQIHKSGDDGNILNNIAFAFPVAAPFYISYLILGMALHTGFELLGFMVPLIQHLGARNAITPRIRAIKTLPRNFNRYYWLPFHILIVSIVFLFALLNPLVIPFALVYMLVAMIVFKKNFAYTYFRKFNEKEGVMYFVRLLRFSLDGLLVGQIVILIFFSVTKQSAVYIALTAILLPINVGTKLLATRLWKSQCRALEDGEANALCGIQSADLSAPSTMRDYLSKQASFDQRSEEEVLDYSCPLDARASGRFPPRIVAPHTESRVLQLWSYIQDKFNANGNDRPSFVVSAQARGSQLNARTVTSAVANVPLAMGKSLSRGGAVKRKSSVGNDGLNRERESYARRKAIEQTSPTRYDAMSRDKEGGEEFQKIRSAKGYAAGKLSWSASTRSNLSEEAPFLSGYDVIANHAPVASQDDYSDYYDGELDRSASIRTIFASREEQLHHRRSTTHNSTPVKSRNADLGEDTYRGSPLLEEDEPDARKASLEGQNKLESTSRASTKSGEEQDGDGFQETSLVRPHGKIQWDDTPNNSARYNNPFYSVELDPFLWLPRDPMKAIDLCDTIEWHGSALVSSQGGAGRVGEWEDDVEQGEGVGGNHDDNDVVGVEHEDTDGSSTLLHGNEQIEILGPLAQRLQEAEDADEAVDPTKSIPRNQMEGYKKALDEAESIDSPNNPRRSNSLTAGLMRASSMMSHQSRRPSNEISWGKHASGEEHAKQHHQLHVQHLQHQNQQQHHEEALDEGDETELAVPLSEAGMKASLSGMSLAPPGQKLSRLHSSTSEGAVSALEGSSVIDHGEIGSIAAKVSSPNKRTISMRKALKAEVLEEEYRRTIRARLLEKKKRAKEEAIVEELAEKNAESRREMDQEAMEMEDLEAQTNKMAEEESQSKIMNRHERRMHASTSGMESGAGKSRREGNMSVASVKAIVISPFKTSKKGEYNPKSSSP